MNDVDQITKPAIDFVPDGVREKYGRERDKRLRADAENQYVQMSGPLAQFLERDPHVEPGFAREPLTDEVDVVVVGGGFGGLLAAARLREAGVNDIRIIEAAGDFGGTWYWNRYPGAQCDIDSYCYLPLLEELNYVPKERYAYAEEILEHAQRVGRAFNLYDAALFQTRVRDLRWAEDTKRWTVHTNRNDAIKARFVIVAMGTTSQPKLPGVTGIEKFEGHAFHTSRWDYDYTGGDSNGNLHKLADKRVAVIGTGATETPNISTSFSAPPPRLVFVATSRPIRSGRAACSLAGSGNAARTSMTSPWESRSRPIWSTTAGPRCSATTLASRQRRRRQPRCRRRKCFGTSNSLTSRG